MQNSLDEKMDELINEIRLWIQENHPQNCSVDITPFVTTEKEKS